MRPKSSASRFFADSARWIPALVLAVVVSPVAASGAGPCEGSQLLPLDRSIRDSGFLGEPARYTLETATPGLLLIEARETGASRVPPGVRLLDADCRVLSTALPLPAIHGRQVHRVSAPDRYFLEVTPETSWESDFRLDVWLVPETSSTRRVFGSFKTDGTGDPPHEPLDEWDELRIGGDVSGEAAVWWEIAGQGALEILERPDRRELRFHTWCPWSERPELLSTFTCARRLQLGAGGKAEADPWFLGTPETLGLTLASAGWLSFGSTGGFGALFDDEGRFVAELTPGRSELLAAGHYFLRMSSPSPEEAWRIEISAGIDPERVLNALAELSAW